MYICICQKKAVPLHAKYEKIKMDFNNLKNL